MTGRYQRKAPNQIKVFLDDSDFDWIYRRADKRRAETRDCKINIAGTVREVIAEARKLEKTR